jgi:hypothetical protein
MNKFLITERSYNRKAGSMLVTTSPRSTCLLSCLLRKNSTAFSAGACYAEHGFIGGYLWTSLDRTPAGMAFQKGRIKVFGFAELLAAIHRVPKGQVWRHNQAGDLPSTNQRDICADRLRKIVQANRGRRGFTFTHYDVIDNRRNRQLVAYANRNGLTINLSANNLEHADQLADARCAPVTTLLPAEQTANSVTRKGRKVVICLAISRAGVTCLSCQLCIRASRNVIIGFPAHGGGKAKIV